MLHARAHAKNACTLEQSRDNALVPPAISPATVPHNLANSPYSPPRRFPRRAVVWRTAEKHADRREGEKLVIRGDEGGGGGEKLLDINFVVGGA